MFVLNLTIKITLIFQNSSQILFTEAQTFSSIYTHPHLFPIFLSSVNTDESVMPSSSVVHQGNLVTLSLRLCLYLCVNCDCTFAIQSLIFFFIKCKIVQNRDDADSSLLPGKSLNTVLLISKIIIHIRQLKLNQAVLFLTGQFSVQCCSHPPFINSLPTL